MRSVVVDFSALVPKGTVFRAVPDGDGGALLLAGRMVDGVFVGNDEMEESEDVGAIVRDLGRDRVGVEDGA